MSAGVLGHPPSPDEFPGKVVLGCAPLGPQSPQARMPVAANCLAARRLHAS